MDKYVEIKPNTLEQQINQRRKKTLKKYQNKRKWKQNLSKPTVCFKSNSERDILVVNGYIKKEKDFK